MDLFWPRNILARKSLPSSTKPKTKERLQEEESYGLEWSNQSQDLNPIRNLWNNLKRVVHRRSTWSLIDLVHFSINKLPNQEVMSYLKTPRALTKYQLRGVYDYLYKTFLFFFFFPLESCWLLLYITVKAETFGMILSQLYFYNTETRHSNMGVSLLFISTVVALNVVQHP